MAYSPKSPIELDLHLAIPSTPDFELAAVGAQGVLSIDASPIGVLRGESEAPGISLNLTDPLPASLDFEFGAWVPTAQGVLSASAPPIGAFAGAIGVSGAVAPMAPPIGVVSARQGARGLLDESVPDPTLTAEGLFSFYVQGVLNADSSAIPIIAGDVGVAGAVVGRSDAVPSLSAAVGVAGGVLGQVPAVVSASAQTGSQGLSDLSIRAHLAGLARQGAQGPSSPELPPLGRMEATGAWDANAPRGPRGIVHAVHEIAVKTPVHNGVPWDYSAKARPEAAERWEDGRPVRSNVDEPFRNLDRFPQHRFFPHAEGSPLSTSASAPYVGAYRKHQWLDVPWVEGTDVPWQLTGPWLRLWKRRSVPTFPFQHGSRSIRCWVGPWQIPYPGDRPCWRGPFQEGRPPIFIWPWPIPVPPPEPPKPFVPPLDLELRCRLPLPIWSGADFYLDIETCDRVLPRGWVPLVVPGVIIVVHNLTIVTLPDGTPIPCVEMTITTDWDSWAWRWSASVAGQDVSEIVHAAKEIELRIDDFRWRGIAESYESRRQFGLLAASLSGRSLSAYLAEPWTEPRSRIEATARTAVQIAEDELYETGWTLDWDTVDWLLPAGSFSYDAQPPIGAIRLLAETVGAFLHSHPWDKILLVGPRYKVPSWGLASADPDVEIPESVATNISSRLQPGTLYRGAWVSGRTVGVAARVYREGTDGAPYAPMVVDAFMTHTDAARERGTQILSAGGRRAHVTVTMPLLPDIGVVRPGSIVAVGSGASRWKGYVMSVSINAGHTKVIQTLTIDRPLEVP